MDVKSGETELNPPSPEKGQAKLNILVVDDEPMHRDFIPRQIEASLVAEQVGLIETAIDGQEAFDKIDKNKGKFNVVLTDGNMPKMNGLNLARKIKESGADIAVVLMSSGIDGLNINDPEVQQSIKKDYGIVAILSKPFDVKQISDTLSQIKILER